MVFSHAPTRKSRRFHCLSYPLRPDHAKPFALFVGVRLRFAGSLSSRAQWRDLVEIEQCAFREARCLDFAALDMTHEGLAPENQSHTFVAGERVSRFKEGDRVYALALANPKGGFYAEYIAVKADGVSLIPGHLTTEQAGAMPFDAVTALRGLDDTLGVRPGQSLMMFGASGGIGHMAVQLARRIGARVFAVASGDDGVELVKRLGAGAAWMGTRRMSRRRR